MWTIVPKDFECCIWPVFLSTQIFNNVWIIFSIRTWWSVKRDFHGYVNSANFEDIVPQNIWSTLLWWMGLYRHIFFWRIKCLNTKRRRNEIVWFFLKMSIFKMSKNGESAQNFRTIECFLPANDLSYACFEKKKNGELENRHEHFKVILDSFCISQCF